MFGGNDMSSEIRLFGCVIENGIEMFPHASFKRASRLPNVCGGAISTAMFFVERGIGSFNLEKRCVEEWMV